MGYRDPEFETPPEGWSVSLLKDVVEIHNTKREPLNSQDRVGRKGEYPYCGANGVVDHIDDYKYDGEYVLIAEDGGYWGKHEPSSYIMRGKFWVNNHAHVVRAKDGVTTNTFFSFMVNYLNIDPFIGGDARGKLTKAVLQDLEIPHPEFVEQQRIAQVLSTVQQAIEQQERLIRTTTELKQNLMRELLIRPIDDEEPTGERDQINVGSLPSGWKFIPLGDFCDFKGGTQPPKSTFIYEPREGYVRLLQIRDFETDKYACYIQRTKRLSTIANDDVSIARYGASVGRILTGKAGAINVAIMTMLPDEAKVSKRFLYYILQLEDFQKHITSLGGRSAQAGFNRGEIAPFRFPLPPLKVQEEITTALDALGTKATHHLTKKKTLQDLFRTLLHELMTGKVRVNTQNT